MPETGRYLEMDIVTGKRNHSWRKSARVARTWPEVAGMFGLGRSRPYVVEMVCRNAIREDEKKGSTGSDRRRVGSASAENFCVVFLGQNSLVKRLGSVFYSGMVGVSQRPTQCTEHILGGDGRLLQSRAACGVAGAVGGCQSCLQRRAGNSDTRTDTAQCWIRIASMLDITIFHSGSALWQPGSVR